MGRCSAFDMKIIFYSHANKTHFHKKGCAPSLILKVRVLELGRGLLFSLDLIQDTTVTLLNGLRESSFNMTRGGMGGDEDIETRSLKF